ncbi:hypothetical protein [Hymenobacter negativus]|uniref:DUF4476 domain-containing protein n=1 Tax=Hymenobacter negativus TaxID=2795026 RepID=A0ABS3QJ51_9BACT|nr:hypothetical protein [Hymenobacter negativus]MBO2010809.1 hypothetical protein [Hymenobacter negativus]
MKRPFFLLLSGVLLARAGAAQVITKDQATRTAEGTVNSRANGEISRGVNAGIDGIGAGVKGLFGRRKDKPTPAAPAPASRPATAAVPVAVARPVASGGQRVRVPGANFSVQVPAGWAYSYLRISSMLPDRPDQPAGPQESESMPATTPPAQLGRMNGLQLYRLSDPNDQLMVFAHAGKPALSQAEFTAVVQSAARSAGGAAPQVSPAKVGAGLPAYRVENAAFGLKLVSVYAYRDGRRYGFSATRAPAQFAPLQKVFDQVTASFEPVSK